MPCSKRSRPTKPDDNYGYDDYDNYGYDDYDEMMIMMLIIICHTTVC